MIQLANAVLSEETFNAIKNNQINAYMTFQIVPKEGSPQYRGLILTHQERITQKLKDKVHKILLDNGLYSLLDRGNSCDTLFQSYSKIDGKELKYGIYGGNPLLDYTNMDHQSGGVFNCNQIYLIEV